MTEKEWRAATSPFDMLRWLESRIDARPFRLFVAACCRAVFDETTPDDARRAVDVLERYADGLCVDADAEAARVGAAAAARRLEDACYSAAGPWVVSILDQARFLGAAAGAAFRPRLVMPPWMQAFHVRPSLQCALLRDIVGDPFRTGPAADPAWLAWSDGVVRRLAQEAYDSREFSALPILGDALEEAGCPTRSLLDHLRSPGPHVRGCWALDTLLDKR